MIYWCHSLFHNISICFNLTSLNCILETIFDICLFWKQYYEELWVVEKCAALAIITNTIYHSSSSSVNISTYSSSSFIQLIFYLLPLRLHYPYKSLSIQVNANHKTQNVVAKYFWLCQYQHKPTLKISVMWSMRTQYVLVLNDSHEYFSQIPDSQLSNENYRRIMFHMKNKTIYK